MRPVGVFLAGTILAASLANVHGASAVRVAAEPSDPPPPAVQTADSAPPPEKSRGDANCHCDFSEYALGVERLAAVGLIFFHALQPPHRKRVPGDGDPPSSGK